MKYELFQTISQILIFGGIVLTGLGGLGAYYFGGKIDDVKDSISINKEKDFNLKIDTLLDNNKSLKEQLKPFEVLLDKYYPNQDKDNAVKTLSNELENLKYKIQDRQINTDQEVKLLNNLRKFPIKTITINSVMGDQEAYKFAHEFKKIFIQAGWNVNGINQSFYDGPMSGLFINSKQDPAPKIINDFYGLMNYCGFEIKGNQDPSSNENEIVLIIGKKE